MLKALTAEIIKALAVRRRNKRSRSWIIDGTESVRPTSKETHDIEPALCVVTQLPADNTQITTKVGVLNR